MSRRIKWQASLDNNKDIDLFEVGISFVYIYQFGEKAGYLNIGLGFWGIRIGKFLK